MLRFDLRTDVLRDAALFLLAAIFVPGCDGKADTAVAPTEPTPAATQPAQSEAPTNPALPARIDLTASGLPLRVSVPTCAKPSKPLVVVPDNASDIIVACDPPESEGVDAVLPFAIQIGLAKGKLGKTEIADDPNFVAFTHDEGGILRWDVNVFGQVRHEFMVRAEVAGTAYACFPQFGAFDPELDGTQLAACRSLAPAS